MLKFILYLAFITFNFIHICDLAAESEDKKRRREFYRLEVKIKKTIERFAEKKYQLRVMAVDCPGFECIESAEMWFLGSQVIDLNEARYMAVDLLTFVYNYLNYTPAIHTFLEHYPLAFKDMELEIQFTTAFKKGVPKAWDERWIVIQMFSRNGKMAYVLLNPADRRIWSYIESIEEAREALTQGRGLELDNTRLKEVYPEPIRTSSSLRLYSGVIGH